MARRRTPTSSRPARPATACCCATSSTAAPPRDYERAECPYDGVAVQWYESWDAFWAMRDDPRHAAVRADAAELFGERARGVHRTRDGGHRRSRRPREPVTKLICGVRHKPGMDLDDFHRYWWEVHGPLNRDTPAVRKYFIRYEQNHRLPEDYARTGGSDLDGVTIEWFRSRARLLRHGGRPGLAAT